MAKKAETFTTEEVANLTGLSKSTVPIYAKRYGIGQKFGWSWAFTKKDIEVIKKHQAGTKKPAAKGRKPAKARA